jgi:hypothetical protein
MFDTDHPEARARAENALDEIILDACRSATGLDEVSTSDEEIKFTREVAIQVLAELMVAEELLDQSRKSARMLQQVFGALEAPIDQFIKDNIQALLKSAFKHLF